MRRRGGLGGGVMGASRVIIVCVYTLPTLSGEYLVVLTFNWITKVSGLYAEKRYISVHVNTHLFVNTHS